MMTDIFDAKVSCKDCDVEMRPSVVMKGGFQLRAVQCPECKDVIIHPTDLNGLEHYNNLRGKTFSVKLRVVGNSHAISIPKEIVDFMHEIQKQASREIDDIVKLCFEDFGKLSVNFIGEKDEKIS